ncbi:MAG: fasciclin domain-containing protein [Leptolyngbyaceae cyanobacterium CSU_1_4]|nr:fasciclin domain-containing protein [Leptolyngbyaceae cyanobacterium CSU_1_4]
MLQVIRKSNKLLIAASIGLMTAIAACENSGTTNTTTNPGAASTVTESPLVSPTVSASPSTAASGTISEVLAENSSFSTLLTAAQAAGVQETLSEPGSITVFAPTNEAFAALPAGTLDKLLLPENREQLRKILSYHVVPTQVTSADIKPGEVATVEGQPLSIESSASNITVNDASVIQPDVTATNGVIHGIDKVLLPPDVQL